jgi:hypothetical protein
MPDFVSLLEVKDALRIDEPDADDDLILKITEATERVRLHLNGASPYEPAVDEEGQPVFDEDGARVYTENVRPVVRTATAMLVGVLRRYPSGDEGREFEGGELPPSVRALLKPLRRLTLA